MNQRLRVIAGHHKGKLVEIGVNADHVRTPGDLMTVDPARDRALDAGALAFELRCYRRLIIAEGHRDIHVLIPFEMTDAEGGAAYEAFIAGR